MSIENHPTVKKFLASPAPRPSPPTLSGAELRQILLDLGADDVGFVSVERADIAQEKNFAYLAFPRAKTYVTFVSRLNREPVRGPKRSAANLEFHANYEHLDHVARGFVRVMEDRGVGALNPSAAFPMEMDQFPGRIWVLAHKPIAVAAGLGRMGLHRNVIHPKFGNFINLATVVIDAHVDEESKPIDYNPCIDCKLCVVSCPVGAIGADGHFNMSTCATHNYKEFMGGFNDWVADIADSKNAQAYREKHSVSETASIWQSLTYKANYKAAYCISACPAGDDVIGEFLSDRKKFFDTVVKPLQDKPEIVYAHRNSDAIKAIAQFPNKRLKITGRGMRPANIPTFLAALPRFFQPVQSEGLAGNYQFTFIVNDTTTLATIEIFNKSLVIRNGHVGSADVQLQIEGEDWLRFLRYDTSWNFLRFRRGVRLKGDVNLLNRFRECFPC